jgi:site-specific recombinase XerD
MRLSALTSDCLRYLDSTGKSKHTLASYDVAFRQLVSFITSTLRLSDDAKHLTEQNIMSFQVHLSQTRHPVTGKQMNPNSVRSRLSAVSRLVKFGSTRKDARGRPLVATTEMANVERPKRKRPKEKWLQDAEIAAYFAVFCEPRVAIIRDVLWDLSLRA